jgi:hypothetical protein
MSTIVKIKSVIAYTHADQRGECNECLRILDSAGIHYEHVDLGTTITMKVKVLEHLNACVYGPDFTQYTFDSFPVILWQECYDDYERFLQVVRSFSALSESTLIRNASLVS